MRVFELIYAVCYHITLFELSIFCFLFCYESNGDVVDTRTSFVEGEIGAFSDMNTNTYEGHAFRLRSKEGALLLEYVARKTGRMSFDTVRHELQQERVGEGLNGIFPSLELTRILGKFLNCWHLFIVLSSSSSSLSSFPLVIIHYIRVKQW